MINIEEHTTYSAIPDEIRYENHEEDPIAHPSFKFGKEAAKRKPLPGEIISDGVMEFLVLDPPEICSDADRPWIIFEVPPLGLFKIVGIHASHEKQQFNKYDEVRNRVLHALPHILEELDMGVDVTRRILYNKIKEIMFK